MSKSQPAVFAALVLAASLALTWLIWDHENRAAGIEVNAELDFAIRNVSSRIEQRAASYEQILRGIQGLVATPRGFDRDAFRTYVQALQLETNFSGIQTIGYVEVVPAARRDAHVAEMRRQVEPGYAIRPEGDRAVYAPIIQREPYVGPNQIPVGFDAWSEPVRRLALEKARDTGMAALTGRLRLKVETDPNAPPGFIMYAPIYAPGAPSDTIEQRRRAITGWAFVSFRMTDFMASLHGERPPGLALRIHDGVQQSDATLIHRAGGSEATTESGQMISEYLVIAGRSWSLTMAALPDFQTRYGRNAAKLIALGGILFSALLSLLAWVMVTGRSRAMDMAARMTHELRESEQRWAFALEGAGDGVWDWNLRTGEAVNSSRWEQIVGCGETCGADTIESWKTLIHPEDRTRVAAAVDAYRTNSSAAKAPLVFEYRIGCCGKPWKWVLSRGMAVSHDAQGHPARVIGTISDITERKATEERIRHMAQHDALTDLPNRALFSDRLQLVLAQARRNDERFALIFLDLDNFKPINDNHGHAVGDQLLRQVARRLQAAVRESDTVGRIGGDEFVVLMPGLSGSTDAMALAEKMRLVLREPFSVDGLELAISSSFGVAVYPEDGEDEIALAKSADEAMYRAKGGGRDSVMAAQAAPAT